MSDIFPEDKVPFMVVGNNLVAPSVLLGVLFEVTARHDRAVAERFAKRLFEDEDSSWSIDDVAAALKMDVFKLHDEWKAECDAKFAETRH